MKQSNAFKRVSPLAVVAECENIAANKFGYGFVAIANVNVVAPKKTAAEWFGKFESDFSLVKKITKVLNEESERLQLRLTFKQSDKTSFESRYIVGGRLATDEEREFIESHLRPTYTSSKQSERGISEEEQVMCRNYKVSNFVAIGKSDIVRQWWESNIK